jgi:hypothetical protein
MTSEPGDTTSTHVEIAHEDFREALLAGEINAAGRSGRRGAPDSAAEMA